MFSVSKQCFHYQAAVTEEIPIIPSSIYLALGLGVLLGLGDGGFNVSIYAALGMWRSLVFNTSER